ncbi:MAG: hypothetical protein NTU89_00815 [Candidatus Dependentiae bacterium]|nr:hypothetical protein [Candidatus Dependentiae bacterium]
MAKMDMDFQEYERVFKVKLDPRMRIILTHNNQLEAGFDEKAPPALVAKRSENVGTKPVDMAKMDRDIKKYERVMNVKVDPRMRIILANPEENR